MESKNCRLKITAISKNYGLKIPVRARMYARVYARVYDCQDSTGHTTSTPTDTEHQRRKREEHGKAYKQNLLFLGDRHANIEKKVKKSL